MKDPAQRARPTRLVADANVLIAAFLKDSTVRRIVILSGLQLLVPEYLLEELEAHFPELWRRSGLREEEAREMLERLLTYFTVVPHEIVAQGLPEATRVMEAIDPRDTAYVAAALGIDCDGIWSDDPHLKRQESVACWTTRELVRELKKIGFRP